MRPVYFDLTVTDLDAARSFFGAVLGWRFERFPMPGEYCRITAGTPDEPGIDGGIGRAADAPLSGGRPLTVLRPCRSPISMRRSPGPSAPAVRYPIGQPDSRRRAGRRDLCQRRCAEGL